MLDMANEAHREALRWACGDRVNPAPNQHASLALAVAQEPICAAEVLRGLLDACGVATLDKDRGNQPSDTIQVWPHDTQRGTFWNERGGQWVMAGLLDVVRAIEMPKLPPLLLALLDIPLDAPDRRERALQALRGAS